MKDIIILVNIITLAGITSKHNSVYNKLSVIHVLHTVTPDIQKLNTFGTVSTSATSWSLQMCLLKGLMH